MTAFHPDRPEGYELPLAGSLTQPIMLAGLPREYAILMGTLALVLGLALKLWWLGLMWWGVTHALGLWFAKTDLRFVHALPTHSILISLAWHQAIFTVH